MHITLSGWNANCLLVLVKSYKVAALFVCAIFLFSFLSQAHLCRTFLSFDSPQVQKVTSQIKYYELKTKGVAKGQGLQVPYVFLKPTKKLRTKETIVLVAGFGVNLKSWIPHTQHYLKKGHPVLIVENFNVGYSLKKNGVLNLEHGQGFSLDAEGLLQVIRFLKIKKLSMVGHSRGGRVAAQVALSLSLEGVDVKRLVLASTYESYIWRSDSMNFLFDYMVNLASDIYIQNESQQMGRRLNRELTEHNPINQELEGLSSQKVAQALGQTLIGTRPESFSTEIKTSDIVVELLKAKVLVKVIAAENDKELSPRSATQALERLDGVEFKLLEGRDHFWPLSEPELLIQESL